MPSSYRNVVAVLEQRQRCSKTYTAVCTELQRIAEEKAALAEMQEIHCQVPPSVRSTFLTSFSPDSTKVASTHGDHKIYICDVRSGKLLHKLEGHQRTPWCLSFHPTSNDILASGCLAGEVRVWHLHGGSEKWQNSHNFVITSLAFHPLDQMLVIATANEIHFWDWSLPAPFATCTTNCPEEKVRFVKFDRLGSRLITGIAVLPEPFPGPSSSSLSSSSLSSSTSSSSSSCSRVASRSQPQPQQQQRTAQQTTASMAAQLSYRRNLLTRLMNMYQHIETLEEASLLGRRSSTTNAPPQEEALYRARHYAEATTQASRLQRQLRDQYAEQLPDPNAANLTFPEEPTSEQRELLDSHEEFLVRAFWRTFHRLRSICTALERRMTHLQRNTEAPSGAEVRPPTVPQFSEPSESEPLRSPPSTTIRNSQAGYWQIQYRITEILQRLANVTGYRARLTILRDQIFEVAERAQRRGGESYSVRRLDLAHCLWLVEMSLQLTQQMQRILHADYRITQLNFNSSRRLVPNAPPGLSDNRSSSSLPRDNSVPLRRNSAPDAVRNSDTALQSDLDAIARDNASLETSMDFPYAPPRNNPYDTSSLSSTSSTHSNSNVAVPPLSCPSSISTSNDETPMNSTPAGRSSDTGGLSLTNTCSTDISSNSGVQSLSNTSSTDSSSNSGALSLSNASSSGNSSNSGAPSLSNIFSSDSSSNSAAPSLSNTTSSESSSNSGAPSLSNTSSTDSSSNSANPLRNCVVCNTQGGATDAGSSEEFDEAWERLRVVVRQELESLTERFRSGSNLLDINFLDAHEERFRNLRQRRPSSFERLQYLASSAEQQPISPSLSGREPPPPPPASNSVNESGPSSQNYGFSSGAAPSLHAASNHSGLFNIANQIRSALLSSAPSQSSDSAQPNRVSYNDIIRERIMRVPEIHVVPSAEEIEPSVLLPVHERPRSPPLPAILSGANDPVLSTMGQSLDETTSRPRYAENHGNIIHRIQSWDFTKYNIPAIKNTKANVVVHRCKIHNDASVDISSDGEMLVALLPPSAESLMFAVFSLKPETLGQILLVSNFDSNAISLSFSPLGQYIVVGLATSRLSHTSMNKQAVAQIFELKYKGKNLVSSHVRSLTQELVPTPPNHVPVSLNSVQWLPRPGEGLIYGTNRGCLRICKPVCPMNGMVIKIVKNNPSWPIGRIRNIPGMRYSYSVSPNVMFSASTQTMEAGTQTTGTQTTGGGDSRVR